MKNDIEARNLKENKRGSIDMEIKHPVYGWIPFTASENDPESHGRVIYKDAKKGKYGKIEKGDK